MPPSDVTATFLPSRSAIEEMSLPSAATVAAMSLPDSPVEYTPAETALSGRPFCEAVSNAATFEKPKSRSPETTAGTTAEPEAAWTSSRSMPSSSKKPFDSPR